MKIIISNNADRPLYQQIEDQIKDAILKEELVEGDTLPSIRAFANDLKVSVLTIRRVYEELEREGFITTVVGKGSFVREADQEFVREERLRAVEGHLQAAVDAARQCGMDETELVDILKLLFEEA